MTRPARRKVPRRIARVAMFAQSFGCACGCGLMIPGWTEITIDHEPALALRKVNEDRTDYIPSQLDPAYLRIYIRGHDNNKTFGSGGTTRIETRSGDIGKIQHVKRASAKEASHRAVMKAKAGQ